MRLLHTADWHMNDRLGRVDRTIDILHSLERIRDYLEEYRVDVLIVAGDLFSGRDTQEQLREAVGSLKELFVPFLQRGGTMLAISGNHDNSAFCGSLRDALELAAPGRTGANGTDATGRLYVAPRPQLIKLADPLGNVVQFVLMPYPKASDYVRGEAMNYRSLAEKNSAIQHNFAEVLQTLRSRVDPKLPSVLVSHIHVRGVQVNSLFRLSEAEDILFEPTDIPAEWAYVAYGHIHKPQPAVIGAEHIRYSGSVQRMDAAEADDQKSVVLVDIGPSGRQSAPQLLPLECVPIYKVGIDDPDSQLSKLANTYANATEALVDYTLYWQPGKHNRDDLCRQIEAIFPRWYSRDFVEIGRDASRAKNFSPNRLQDVAGTVRDYLNKRLEKHPERQELTALAEKLLAEGD